MVFEIRTDWLKFVAMIGEPPSSSATEPMGRNQQVRVDRYRA